MNSRDEWKYKTVDTFTKLPPLYEEGQRVAAMEQVADVVKLTRRVIELNTGLEEKDLHLQTPPSLAQKKRTLRAKVEKMRTPTTCLESKNDAILYGDG